MSVLLSAKFGSNALDDAVVVNTGQDQNEGLGSTTLGTRQTVSMSGLWGWLGWREHTSSTLTQQKALFAQLKAELRQEYLGEAGSLYWLMSAGQELNDDICRAEKKGSYRGDEHRLINTLVAKTATMMRLEREIDGIAAKKGAFISPRMIADFKRRAEIQFASHSMSEIQNYRPRSIGGLISCDQSFNAVSDYKTLLRGTDAGSKVIRFSKGTEASDTANKADSASAAGIPKLLLVPAVSVSSEKNIAQQTLAHCLASLKQAYFRVSADCVNISSKEVAFDRAVSLYVESKMVDRVTGRLRELTKNDFDALEKLAFTHRSTKERCETPFNEMFDKGGATVRSRYSGFTLDKDVGVVHLISAGNGHAMMYIETFDPAARAWHLTELHFAPTESPQHQGRSFWQKWMGEEISPGQIMLSQATVIGPGNGEEPRYQPCDVKVISRTDRRIGASGADQRCDVVLGKKTEDVTSIRLPAAAIQKMLKTVRVQHEGSDNGTQGNGSLYHLKGQSLPLNNLLKQLGRSRQQQAEAMLALARVDMLLDKIHEFDREAAKAQSNARWKRLSEHGSASETTDEPEFKMPLNGQRLSLPDYLRAQGVFAPLSEIQGQGKLSEAQSRSMTEILTAKVNAWKAMCSSKHVDRREWETVPTDIQDKLRGVTRSVNTLLEGKGLCADERRRLQALEENINSLSANVWQHHRAIHQLSQKVHNWPKIESLDTRLKAARKELDMRMASKTLAKDNWIRMRNKLASAMQSLELTAHPEAQTEVTEALKPLREADSRAHDCYAQHAARVAAQQEMVSGLEDLYDDLSADMVKGADGYMSVDEKGRRAVRAGNCAEWLRNMLQLAGVTIEGFDNAAGHSWVPESLRTPHPNALASGKYENLRSGFARAGIKLHEPPTPAVQEIAPQPRTAALAGSTFLSEPRLNGVQYDIVWP